MLFTLTEIVISLGIVMAVTSASSTISTEIEVGTFESLLLTPITGRQIAFHKAALGNHNMAFTLCRINSISICDI